MTSCIPTLIACLLTIMIACAQPTIIRFSPSGNWVASTNSYVEEVKILDAATGKLVKNLKHEGFIYDMQFSADGKKLLTACGKTAYIWSIELGKVEREVTGHSEVLKSVQFGKTGKWILTTSWAEESKIWSTENGDLLKTYSASSLSDKGDLLLVLSKRNIDVVNTSDWSVIRSLEIPETQPNLVYTYAGISPNEKWIATYDNAYKKVKVTDVKTGEVIQSFDFEGPLLSNVLFDPSGKKIITIGTEANQVQVWDLSSGKPLFTLTGEQFRSTMACVFSPNGSLVANNHFDDIKITSANSGALIKTIEGNQPEPWTDYNGISAIEFDGTGKWIAASFFDGVFKLWEVSTGRLLFSTKTF